MKPTNKPTIQDIERMISAFLIQVLPLFTLFIPGYLIYTSLRHEFDWDPVWAFLGALFLEGVGFSAIATAIEFYEAQTKDVRYANLFRIAMGVSGVYLVLVMLLNVILGSESILHKLAAGLLSLMTPMSGVLAAIRRQFLRMQAEAEGLQQAETSQTFEMQKLERTQAFELERIRLQQEAETERTLAAQKAAILQERWTIRKQQEETPQTPVQIMTPVQTPVPQNGHVVRTWGDLTDNDLDAIRQVSKWEDIRPLFPDFNDKTYKRWFEKTR